MLTRLVRIQLIVFMITSVIGMAVMTISYLQVPTLLGFGRMRVTVEIPATGGLYRFANVTYRGVQLGRVTAVDLTDGGAKATLTLDASARVPADVTAAVRSISAVGEQYVDLIPRSDTPPYLHDGSVIALRDTSIPQPVGPMLDQVSSLVHSIPKAKLGDLLDESFAAFNAAGSDMGSMLESGSILAHDTNGVSGNIRSLVDDSGPLEDSQVATADAIRTWARSLSSVTEHLAKDDPQVRTLLQKGPGFANETAKLLNQIKPTLPVLLANLTTIGQIAVTYNPSLEQVFVLLPPYVADLQSYGLGSNNPTGLPQGDFSLTLGDPPACTVGFLPPSSWRSPADVTTIDTPDGLYCKLPQDSPIAVRGARNFPCMGHPGKRAPTVEICNSDKPFVPLAMREHALGAYPFDPNIIAQGVPPDDRVTVNNNIFGPLGGTPTPASATGTGPQVAAPAQGQSPAPPQPAPGSATGQDVPSLPQPGGGEPSGAPAPVAPADPNVAPSGYTTHGGRAPSLTVAQYNPRTGKYTAPNGEQFRQTDLVTADAHKSWQDLFPV